MSEKFVIGQIGCGLFAMAHHGPNVMQNPYISRIKWACDISEKKAKEYARKFKAEKITDSFTDVTTDPEVDIILIATSHEARVPIVESAAKHGKHIFCEKPMAMTEWECYQIIRAVRKNKIKFCVDYMRSTAPAVVALKREWLEHKKNPEHQSWRYVETKREKFLEEKVTDFFVRVQDESASYGLRHLDPFTGRGLIVGEAGHWLDLACWLFDNDRPVEIRAWGSTRMRYGIHLSFQSGNAFTITMTPNGTFDYPKEVYEIAHDGALFRMEFFVENQYYGRPGKEKEIFPLTHDSQPGVGRQGGLSGYLEKQAANHKKSTTLKEEWLSIQTNHGLEKMFNAFIDSVRNNTPTLCDEIDGYHATYLANLAMKSIEVNHPLPVSVDKWDYYVHV